MSDTSTATTAATTGATTAAATTAAATPWHQAVDPAIVGHWQNRNIDLADPAKVAIAMTQAHKEAERLIGVPASEMLRMPKAGAPEADVKAFWARLGAPADAKEYDFTAIKVGDQPLDATLADALRPVLAANFVPKDKAGGIVGAVAKHIADQQAAEKGAAELKLAEAKARLAQSWGPNADMNRLAAMQGARRLGVTPEDVSQLERVVGYDRVMEMFRKIGAGTSEDTFVEGKTGGGNPATQAAALARKSELMADQAWREKFLKNDTAAVQEMRNLEYQIAGVSTEDLVLLQGRAA